MSNNSQKKIIVFGATGYIGQNFIDRSKVAGEVLLYCPFRNKPGIQKDCIEWVKIDNLKNFDFTSFIKEKQIEYSINFIGQIKAASGEIDDTNFDLLRIILDQLNNSGTIKRFIHFSSTATLLPDHLKGAYGKSKKKFDQYLINSGIKYVIIKPSAIYGGIGKDNLNKYVQAAREGKICPIIGDGNNLIQPVQIDKVIRSLDEVLQHIEIYQNKEIVLARKEPVSFIELLKEEAAKNNRKLKYIKIPLSLCEILIKTQEIILRNKPIVLWEQIVRSRANVAFKND